MERVGASLVSSELLSKKYSIVENDRKPFLIVLLL